LGEEILKLNVLNFKAIFGLTSKGLGVLENYKSFLVDEDDLKLNLNKKFINDFLRK